MTDKRREELIKNSIPITSQANCGCVFRGSERDEQNCLEMIHIHGIDGLADVNALWKAYDLEQKMYDDDR